jgi:quercetin dioxygenase-like cupin family protein
VNEDPQYTRVSWSGLKDMYFPPLRDDHPWPRRENLTLRVYSVPLGCEHLAFSVGKLEPGQSVYHHHHRDAEEVYLLIEGRSQVRIGSDVIDAKPLDAFRIPPEIDRSVYNNSAEPCCWIFIGAPIAEFLEKSDYTQP